MHASIPCRRGLRVFRAALALCLVLTLAAPVRAIVWCHDWTIWKVTGTNAHRQGPDTLRTILKNEGGKQTRTYKHVLTATAKLADGADATGKLTPEQVHVTITPVVAGTEPKLKPGDVIIIGEAHSGVVRNDAGEIDHFLQPAGTPGTELSPDEAMAMENFHGGGNWTLHRFFRLERKQGKPEGDASPQLYQHPYLGLPIEIWRASGDMQGESVVYNYVVKPGKWTDTGIKLKKGDSVDLSATGEIKGEKDWKISPEGYAHLGFRAWTFKARLNKRYVDIGASGHVTATEDAPLLIGVSYTYEPSADNAKLSGQFDAKVTVRKGIAVEEAVAAAGGKSVEPEAPAENNPGAGGAGAGAAGAGTPGGTGAGGGAAGVAFREQGAKELIVACPVAVTITDAQGRRAGLGADGKVISAIPELVLEATPDGANGHVWYCAFPAGEFTATITGTAKGAARVRTKQKGKPEMTYPPLEVEPGTSATLKVGDGADPEKLVAGTTRELTPTAGALGAAPTTPAGPSATPGGVPAGISSANLKVARWAAFPRITDFPYGDEAHFINNMRLSGDGALIAFSDHRGIWTINRDGTGLRQISPATGVTKLDLSRDGRKIAWFERSQNPSLYVVNADGSGKLKLPTPGVSIMNAVRLTADGSKVVYTSYEKGGIYLMPTDGSDLKRVVDTEAVCKLLGIDTNANHWRDLLDISDDGSHIVFNLLWDMFAVNGDGSGLRRLTQYKDYGLNAIAISGDGRVVAHHRKAGADSLLAVSGYDGSPIHTFKKQDEDLNLVLSSDGSKAGTGSYHGLRLYDVAAKGIWHVTETGSHIWANPWGVQMARDFKRGAMVVDGPMSTDQGRPNQLVAIEISPDKLAGVPPVDQVTVMPKFLLATQDSQATVTLKTATEPPPVSVASILIRDGVRVPDQPHAFDMQDSGGYGDEKKEDGVFTSQYLSARGYSGKPIAAGPVGLRVHVMGKGWDLTVVELDGIEVKAP